MKKFVVAIDPGTVICGYSCLSYDEDSGDILLEDSGYVQLSDSDSLLDKLNCLYTTLISLVSTHQPQYVMLEKTFRVDRGSLALVVAIKILKETCEIVEGLKVVQENAMRVRKHFGVGARDSATAKEKVKKFVLEHFELDDDLPNDVYDAVLLGYYLIDVHM